MFCSKCGNELHDGQIFCPKCGSKIETIETNGLSATNSESNSTLTNSSVRQKSEFEEFMMQGVSDKPTKSSKFIVFFLIFFTISLLIWLFAVDGCDSPKTQKTSTKNVSSSVIDEDAIADKNCKNDLGFSNIYACRRALSSAGLDADKYIREKWNTSGNRIKGIGFCEGFTRSKHSDQYKVHYDKDCNAKELYIWSDKLGDFQRIK